MKKGIFISYCHNDKQLTDGFINNLKKVIPNVSVDKSEVSFGNDFNAYEKSIEQNLYKTILVLCTPEYKKRADNDIEDSGVRREVLLYEKYLLDPKQNYIIPIIVEGDSNSSLPKFFKNQVSTSYVDLSMNNILDTDTSKQGIIDDNFTILVNILQGIYPPPTILSELEAAIHYISAPMPGADKKVKANFKRDLSMQIIDLCEKANNTIVNLGYWLDVSTEMIAIEKAIEKMTNEIILEYPNVIIKLLFYSSKWYNTNTLALDRINRAIEIAQSDTNDKQNKEREYELYFQKAIILHKMKKLDEALNIYLSLLKKSLYPPIAFESAIYTGHIYTINEKFDKADKYYNIVIDEFEKIPIYIKPYLYKKLELIRNRAISSLNTKTKKHDAIMEDFNKREFNSSFTINGLYPPTMTLPVKVQKPPVVYNYENIYKK